MNEIVNATLCDLDDILVIYQRAREFMAENGNPNQWKKVHPPKESLIENINEQKLYVLKSDQGIEGVFFFDEGPDPTYDYIEGKWLSDRPYSVIHRIASAGRVKGVLKTYVNWCLARCDNIKIDTHADNHIMQNALERLGFKYYIYHLYLSTKLINFYCFHRSLNRYIISV